MRQDNILVIARQYVSYTPQTKRRKATKIEGDEANGAQLGGGDAQGKLENMKVKELKALLKECGVQCVGCTEKAEYVNKARECMPPPPAKPKKNDKKSDAPPTPTAAEKEKERKRKKPPPPTPTAAEHDEMQAELESEKAELDKLKKMQRDSLRKHASNKQARRSTLPLWLGMVPPHISVAADTWLLGPCCGGFVASIRGYVRCVGCALCFLGAFAGVAVACP